MKKYIFERKTYTKAQPSQNDRDALDDRLGVNNKSLSQSVVKHKIDSFLAVFHGNIEWYMEAIKVETRRKNWYKVFTIGLIVLIPLAIYWTSHCVASLTNDNSLKDDIGYYSGFTIAVLTSLIGFHKVLNSWLAQRKLQSIFSEASSGLKSKLYAFEDRWNNGGIYDSTDPTKMTKAFDDDLEKTIAEGRAIADTERKKYYEHVENPEIDLGGILSSSFTQASGLLKNFQSSRFTRKLEELEEERKAAAESKALLIQISQMESQIKELESLEAETIEELKGATDSAKTSMEKLLASIRNKKNELLIELAGKKSKR